MGIESKKATPVKSVKGGSRGGVLKKKLREHTTMSGDVQSGDTDKAAM